MLGIILIFITSVGMAQNATIQLINELTNDSEAQMREREISNKRVMEESRPGRCYGPRPPLNNADRGCHYQCVNGEWSLFCD